MIWAFCDELDVPEICVCLDMDYFSDIRIELEEWFAERKKVGSVIAEGLIYVAPDYRTEFLLRFGK